MASSSQSSTYISTFSHNVGITLLSFSILAGTFFLHGLGWTPSGVMAQLTSIIQDPTSKWPGTETPFLRTFTRVPPIDFLLANLTPFFARIVDGSDPALSVFSLFMSGQYGVAWGLCLMESLREGNQGKVVRYVGIFGTLMQVVGFAVIFPIYLLIHLLTSPIAKSNLRSDSGNSMYIAPARLDVVPVSIIIGYIVPSVLMTLPSPALVSMKTRQNFIAVWQAFPLYTVIIQWILSSFSSSTNPSTKKSKSSRSTAFLTSASRVYTFLLILAITTHLPALFLAICSRPLLQSLSPSLESSLTSSNLTFSSVYIPYLPVLSWRAIDLADGVHTFLWWDTYVSTFAAFVWAFVLLIGVASGTSSDLSNQAGKKVTPLGSVVKITLWTALAGPFGAVTVLLWERDAVILGSSKRDD